MRRTFFLLSFLLFLVSSCDLRLESAAPERVVPSPPTAPVSALGGTVGQATVTRIVDGDSYYVTTGGKPFEVRMIGIDTAEVNGHTQKGAYCPDDALGEQAKARLTQLLPVGSTVTLIKDKTERSYDRYLRYTDSAEIGDVGLVMIREGWARPVQVGRDKARWPQYWAAGEASRVAGGLIWSCVLVGG